MKKFPALDWRALSIELVIVFVGLFAALQLDDWRQQQELHEAEIRYLERLRDDLQDFLTYADELLEMFDQNYAGVLQVHQSLEAGEILNGDSRKFETGLIYVGHLPSLQMQRSTYDEMVASGMFARLRSESLKREISTLYATHEGVNRNFSWWRNGPEELMTMQVDRVRFYSEGVMDRSISAFKNEPVRRVEYDFEALRSDPVIRNGYYWAVDNHSDWILWTKTLTGLAENAVAMVGEELQSR